MATQKASFEMEGPFEEIQSPFVVQKGLFAAMPGAIHSPFGVMGGRPPSATAHGSPFEIVPHTTGGKTVTEAGVERLSHMVPMHSPTLVPMAIQVPLLRQVQAAVPPLAQAPPSPFGTASTNSTSTATHATDPASPFGTPALDSCSTQVHPRRDSMQAHPASPFGVPPLPSPFVPPPQGPPRARAAGPPTSTLTSTANTTAKVNTPPSTHTPPTSLLPAPPQSPHPEVGAIPFSPGHSSTTTASTTTSVSQALGQTPVRPAPASHSRQHRSAHPLSQNTAQGGLAARRNAASQLSLNLSSGSGIGNGIGAGGMMSAPLRPRSPMYGPGSGKEAGQQQQQHQQAMSISPHLLHPHVYQLADLDLEPASYFPNLLPSAPEPPRPGMDMEAGASREGAESVAPAGWDGKAGEEVAVQVAGWTAFQGMDMDMEAGMRRGAGAGAGPLAGWDSMFQEGREVHQVPQGELPGLAPGFASSSQPHREWGAEMQLELMQMEMFAEGTSPGLLPGRTTLPFRSTLPGSAPPQPTSSTPSQAPGSAPVSRASAPLPTPTLTHMGAPNAQRRQAAVPPEQAPAAGHSLDGSPSWRSAMATHSPHLPPHTDGQEAVASAGRGFFPFRDPQRQTHGPSHHVSRPSPSLQQTMTSEAGRLQAQAHSHSQPATPVSESSKNENENRQQTSSSIGLPPMSLHDLQTYMHMLPQFAVLHAPSQQPHQPQ